MRQNFWPLVYIAIAVAVGVAIAPHLLWLIGGLALVAVVCVLLGLVNIAWRFITGQKL